MYSVSSQRDTPCLKESHRAVYADVGDCQGTLPSIKTSIENSLI